MAGAAKKDPRIEFFDKYVRTESLYALAASEAKMALQARLEDSGVFLHSVDARAKTPLSLLQKLRSKNYKEPSDAVTDLVGVRVITYFEEDVEHAEAVLRDCLQIDEHNSVDKRPKGHREFGYKSVHLVAVMTKSTLSPALPDELDDCPFEIQVRSILQHSWAEIEHDIVYKSSTDFTDATIRRFAAAAASLEIVEDVFHGLRDAWGTAVQSWWRALNDADNTDAWKQAIDAAGILACISTVLGLDSEKSANELRPGAQRIIQSAIVEEAGLTTPSALRVALRSASTVSALESFASDKGLVVSDLRAGTVTALLVASIPEFPIQLFPDLVEAAHLRAADRPEPG